MSSITIPNSAWTPCGDTDDPDARLVAAVTINGMMFHAEAIAVTTDTSGFQTAAGTSDETLGHLFAAAVPDGPFDTMPIRDREYVVYIHPSS